MDMDGNNGALSRKRNIQENTGEEDELAKKPKFINNNNNPGNGEFSLIDAAMNHIERHSNHRIIPDEFQKEAMKWLNLNHSVFVAAPTSAGKTLIGQFAVFGSVKKGKKVVITAPTKALCNQHFRDFNILFPGNVGLITADNVINPTASCVVMITEVLRKMLYQNDDMINQIDVIIFDEIHYMRNSYRGGVYEECIIHLAHQVQFLFLSATVPNADEFADWISSIQSSQCMVVTCHRRPVPLKFYVVPHRMCTRLFEINNADKSTIAKDSTYALSHREKDEENISSDIFALRTFEVILRTQMFPCIFFLFERNACDNYASYFAENYPIMPYFAPKFLMKHEMERIEEIWTKTFEKLSHEDKELSQVKCLLKYIQHGIGIHHAGLLPVLRLLVETLFNEGIIKIVFATDTLAMGINMPAKTVIFTDITKFQGFYDNRKLMDIADFIQMSGRAGRRGRDKLGNVVMLDNDHLTEENLNTLLTGQCDPIISQLRVKNTLVLNLLSKNGCNSEALLKKTFEYYMFLKENEVAKQELKDVFQDSSPENDSPIKSLCKPDNKGTKSDSMNEMIQQFKLFMSFNKQVTFLQKLGYLNADKSLSAKGEIASQIYSVDGVLLTEMMSSKFFDEFDSATVAALLSCFNQSFFERPDDQHLQKSYKKMEKFVNKMSAQYINLPDLHNGRMDVVYSWAQRKLPFEKICSSVNAGKTLESFRMLNDLLLELENAAATMKNVNLQEKFTDAREMIYRGTVASLFINTNDLS